MNRENTTVYVAEEAEGWLPPSLVVIKPGIVAMVIISALCGMYVAGPGLPTSSSLVFWTMFSIGLATAAAAALNNYIDRDIDLIMRRTSGRPIPSGSLSPAGVMIFGLSGSVVSVTAAFEEINTLTAALLAASIFIYVVVYTLIMKRRTPLATFAGGIGGALPPVIGYTAVRPVLDEYALAMFLIIFAWQHPHFWSLALKYIEEYKAARVNNHAVVVGVEGTKRRIVLWSFILAGASVIPWYIGMAGGIYLAGALTLGVVNIAMTMTFLLSPARLAMRIFFFSLIHLPAVYLLLLFDLTI
ncbi:MAG: heme o synthase [Nitrospinota bacterium]|nr:heme o synthase [Nitrospinota bacterium]MDH5755362.1 heme o synthase [Nitrospinota bacterium]